MSDSLRRAVGATCLAAALIASTIACSDSGSITRSGAVTTSTRASDRSSSTEPDDTTPVTDATAGAASLDDPVTPDAGNGGYDVSRYDLDITVAADRATITGEVTITATATQSLSTFNLDFTGLTVDTVVVDDEPATTSAAGDVELVVTPKRPIGNGTEFTTVVTYSGEPQPVSDPSAPRHHWLAQRRLRHLRRLGADGREGVLPVQ